MGYILIPDSFNRNLLKKLTDNEALELQNKYRNYIEGKIKRMIDFKEIDNRIKKKIYIFPLEDKDYNYYHKFSSFPSNYIYLRNNYHIERLSEEELEQLKTDNVGEEYIKNTLERVLYEEGDFTYYGCPTDQYLAPSKSLIIEFAYDQVEIKTLEEFQEVEKIINEISSYIKSIIQKELNLPVSIIVYNGIPDLYKNKEEIIENTGIHLLK